MWLTKNNTEQRIYCQKLFKLGFRKPVIYKIIQKVFPAENTILNMIPFYNDTIQKLGGRNWRMEQKQVIRDPDESSYPRRRTKSGLHESSININITEMKNLPKRKG
jgi:hypothetical protein